MTAIGCRAATFGGTSAPVRGAGTTDGVGVGVGAGVAVRVGVAVGLAVGLGVAVRVGVAVGVGTLVADGRAATATGDGATLGPAKEPLATSSTSANPAPAASPPIKAITVRPCTSTPRRRSWDRPVRGTSLAQDSGSRSERGGPVWSTTLDARALPGRDRLGPCPTTDPTRLISRRTRPPPRSHARRRRPRRTEATRPPRGNQPLPGSRQLGRSRPRRQRPPPLLHHRRISRRAPVGQAAQTTPVPRADQPPR